MYLVKFYDYSGFAENVVYAPNAPLYDTMVVETATEGFDLAFAFGEEFQISVEEISIPIGR